MAADAPGDVVIVGAGIGGLTLAHALHRAGNACRVVDAAAGTVNPDSATAHPHLSRRLPIPTMCGG